MSGLKRPYDAAEGRMSESESVKLAVAKHSASEPQATAAGSHQVAPSQVHPDSVKEIADRTQSDEIQATNDSAEAKHIEEEDYIHVEASLNPMNTILPSPRPHSPCDLTTDPTPLRLPASSLTNPSQDPAKLDTEHLQYTQHAPQVQELTKGGLGQSCAQSESAESQDSAGESEELLEEDSEMTPEEERRTWEDQNFYYNHTGIRTRAKDLIDWATELISEPRGSPSSKAKVPEIQAAFETTKVSESDVATILAQVLFRKTRLVRREDAPKFDGTINVSHYEARAYQDDGLCTQTRATFLPLNNHVPQQKAPTDSTIHRFHGDVHIPSCVPDLCCGYAEQFFNKSLRAIFNERNAKMTKVMYLPFFTGDLKTQNEPIAAADNQCMRAGAAMVWRRVQWAQQAAGETVVSVQKYEANSEMGTGVSRIDRESLAFAVSAAKNSGHMHVCFREIWDNGAVYWHTVPIYSYMHEEGFEHLTEAFALHVANIVDWGLGPRLQSVIEDTAKIEEVQRKRPLKDDKDVLLKRVRRD